MTTSISVGPATENAVGMTDDEKYERAIAAEFAARIEEYGGVTKYTRDFDIDRRNFSRYLKGRKLGKGDDARLVPNVPPLPALLRHLANMEVNVGDFFNSVTERFELGE